MKIKRKMVSGHKPKKEISSESLTITIRGSKARIHTIFEGGGDGGGGNSKYETIILEPTIIAKLQSIWPTALSSDAPIIAEAIREIVKLQDEVRDLERELRLARGYNP